MFDGTLTLSTIQVNVAVTGLFWQLVMRYNIIGGIMWTMVYSGLAFTMSVAARYRSWYLIHENISRFKMFLLIDAHDTEDSTKGWRCVKVSVMIMSLACCLGMVGVSYYYVNTSWSSFLTFIGIIFGLYYSIVEYNRYIN